MSIFHYRRWSVNLNLRENDVGYSVLQKKPAPCDMRIVQSVDKEMEHKSSYSIKEDAGITAATAMFFPGRKQTGERKF